MKRIDQRTYKEESSAFFDFYAKTLEILKEMHSEKSRIEQILPKKSNATIISYRDIFYRFGSLFHLSKSESILLLKELERRGQLKLLPFKGIRLRHPS